MKPMLSCNCGFNYYAYVLIYVDDVMVIHHNALTLIRIIDMNFNLNTSLVGDPDICLAYKLNKMRLEKRAWAWKNIPAIYVK